MLSSRNCNLSRWEALSSRQLEPLGPRSDRASAWLARGDQEREDEDTLAAALSFGCAAESALEEHKLRLALDAWIEQASVLLELSEPSLTSDLAFLAARVRALEVPTECEPAGLKVRAWIFAALIARAARGDSAPLVELARALRAARRLSPFNRRNPMPRKHSEAQ